MIWYKKLGFNNNPFSIKPAAFQPDLVAYDLDYIYGKIDNAEVVFIEGEYGTGKTTILKNIIAKYKGKNRIIYFSFNEGGEFKISQLLDGANSLIGRLTGLKVRNVILLLDEVHLMSKKDVASVLKYYESGIIKAIVMVSHDYDSVTMPENLEKYLKDNLIKTVSLNVAEAEELIQSRIGEIGLFPKNIIKKIFMLAGKNPRRFLEFSEDVARYAVEMDDYKISDFHVETVLADLMKKEGKQKKQVEAKPKTSKVIAAALAPEITISERREAAALAREDSSDDQDEAPVLQSGKSLSEDDKLSAEEAKPKDKPKKYKMNKLVEGSKDPLGTVEAKEKMAQVSGNAKEEDMPEYKVFVFDN